MILAHKIIDAFRNKESRCSLRALEGTDHKRTVNLINGIEEAEKFDFGELLLEKADVEGKYRLPDLTEAEREFWVSGFIPLPAELCWFEYRLGGKWSGLLVMETKTSPWVVQRVVRHGDSFVYDGCILGIRRQEQDFRSDRWSYLRWGNDQIADHPDVHISVAADVNLSIYFALMLNSKSTEIRTERAPEKLNKARIAKQQTPLFDHRIVDIVPVRCLRDAERVAHGTHTSPRLHWRSSHMRWFDHPTPMSRQAPDGRWGVLIPRQIIGLAEHGSVSHEYRVHHDRRG